MRLPEFYERRRKRISKCYRVDVFRQCHELYPRRRLWKSERTRYATGGTADA